LHGRTFRRQLLPSPHGKNGTTPTTARLCKLLHQSLALMQEAVQGLDGWVIRLGDQAISTSLSGVLLEHHASSIKARLSALLGNDFAGLWRFDFGKSQNDVLFMERNRRCQESLSLGVGCYVTVYEASQVQCHGAGQHNCYYIGLFVSVVERMCPKYHKCHDQIVSRGFQDDNSVIESLLHLTATGSSANYRSLTSIVNDMTKLSG
jgi:hypothetical protein